MNLKNKIIASLEDQKNIFGDELFEDIKLSKRKTTVIKEKNNVVSEDFQSANNLEELSKLICECKNCILGSSRKKFVFGEGNPNADIVLVGEGPGADEDEQGRPFVGRAGQLLTKILESIQLTREEVYICNIVKCRPPGNRNPLPNEMEACIPYLHKQLQIINPQLILCLGLVAAQALLQKKDSLGNFRGKIMEFNNAKVMVTYHPAALLRNPGWKVGCWEDVQQFQKLYQSIKK